MLLLFRALKQSRMLSITAIFYFMQAIWQNGINLMALLQLSTKLHPQKQAITDDLQTLTYEQLYDCTTNATHHLAYTYKLFDGKKVGIISKNHAALASAIFATSRLGCQTYFLHTEISEGQFKQLVQAKKLDAIVYDDYCERFATLSPITAIHINTLHTAFDQLPAEKLATYSKSNLALLTSGTTGAPKEILHKPSLFSYLAPFIAMLKRLRLLEYKSGYVATPIYHGYGLAILILFIALGKKIVVTEKFDAKKACSIIDTHHIEMMTCVPVMLQKMLSETDNKLASLACIASGGAPLSPLLVKETFKRYGPVLYNLYGTSETGLNIIATPDDLKEHPTTLGRLIEGMQLKVFDEKMHTVKSGEIGQLYIKSKSGMAQKKTNWLATGDFVRQDKDGYIYFAGRTDDLVISGGVNVYPIQLENVLLKHCNIADVAVIGVEDETFGQRLHAFVELKNHEIDAEQSIYTWLESEVAPYEKPKEITLLAKIPYSAIGKKDFKALKELYDQEKLSV